MSDKDRGYAGIKIVALDFDGVVLDSSTIKSDVFKEVFARYPEVFNQMWEYHKSSKGIPRRAQFDYLVTDLLNYKGVPRQELIDQLVDDYKKIVMKRLMSAPFINGVIDFLEYAVVHYPVYVVSNAPRDELDLLVEKRGLEKYFVKVFATNHGLNKSKELRNIATQEDVSPDAVLFVGDTGKDQEAAIISNTRFIGIENQLAIFEKGYGGLVKDMKQALLLLRGAP